MIVVSDASPLIALAKLGQLSLLTDLFGRVVVPQTVFEEITTYPSVDSARLFSWRGLEIHPDPRSVVSPFTADLDPGEATAIALVLEIGADLLLIDERKARTAASRLGLSFTGTLGVVLRAKDAGLLPAARPLAEALRKVLYLDSATVEDALLAMGEPSPLDRP